MLHPHPEGCGFRICISDIKMVERYELNQEQKREGKREADKEVAKWESWYKECPWMLNVKCGLNLARWARKSLDSNIRLGVNVNL